MVEICVSKVEDGTEFEYAVTGSDVTEAKDALYSAMEIVRLGELEKRTDVGDGE